MIQIRLKYNAILSPGGRSFIRMVRLHQAGIYTGLLAVIQRTAGSDRGLGAVIQDCWQLYSGLLAVTGDWEQLYSGLLAVTGGWEQLYRTAGSYTADCWQ